MSDSQYFVRRAEEERSAASRAPDAAARGVHLDVAERYDKLAAELMETNMPLCVVRP